MEGKMKDIERKKMGLQKAINSLLVEWKDLQALLDFSTNTTCSKMLHTQKCENPMSEKLKEIDLNNGPCDDLVQVLEIEGKKFKKLMGRNEVLCEEKLKEIEDKMREIEFSKSFIEERAKELELRQKEIDDGFKEFEVKKMEITQKNNKVDAKLVEIEELKWKLNERWEKLNSREKEVERVKVLCEERFEEIVGKVREVDSSRKYIEEYAKELESKRKELDIGFKELESKRMKFTEKSDKCAAINFSNADISMNRTKRKRSSYDLRCRASARTGLPAPQVYQTVLNKNSDGGETFWTCCGSCKFKFKYQKIFVNQHLKCRTCSNSFTAFELDAESIPPESNVHSVKELEFSAKTDKIAGVNSSHADVNMNQMKTKGYTCAEGKSLYGSDKTIKQQVNPVKVVTLDPDTRAANVINDSESNQNWGSLPTAEFVDCPYPEFSDFDKDKDERSFSVDQLWACFDSHDVMPILYGHIRKVFSPDFKLEVTFLKANPEEQNKIDWVKAGLPMVCGKFIHDDTIETSKRLMFSHQIHFEKGSDDGTYFIYPRKGETWALFKDWNIGWSSDPANHRTFKYEMVEILSDFNQETGVEVCYLAKVKGFVSVFRRVAKNGIVTFLIPSSEMLRFSYSVPSSKLTGAERGGVPAGAFELDPASLPTDPDKLWPPEVMETDA